MTICDMYGFFFSYPKKVESTCIVSQKIASEQTTFVFVTFTGLYSCQEGMT